MRAFSFFRVAKDGGPRSTVTGYWLAEIKGLFSIALLRFGNGSRDEFHSHAFNSISWLLTGQLLEEHMTGLRQTHKPGLAPIITKRDTFHRVHSVGTSWVVTFRGPWAKEWYEFDPATYRLTKLGHGRVAIR